MDGAGDGDSVGGGGGWGGVRSSRAAADRAGALSASLGGCLTTGPLGTVQGCSPPQEEEIAYKADYFSSSSIFANVKLTYDSTSLV